MRRQVFWRGALAERPLTVCNVDALPVRGPLTDATRLRDDFSPLPPPSSRRRLPAAFAVLLPLSATVSACGDADIGYLVLPLPASIAVLLGIAILVLLAGLGIGVCIALAYLRAADRAAAQYHRTEIARVLGASSTVHASVQEVLSIIHRRTQELQRLVAMLQKGGAQ
jgi:hypothetical protein